MQNRRQISRVLEKISNFVGSSPDDLAVTIASRRHDPYAVLVSTILSLRARDETTQIVTPALLSEAPNPETLASLSQERIVHLIRQTSFRNTKARHLRGIARDIMEKHDGTVPHTIEELLSFKGVGRKSANLILTLGFGKQAICCDTHVHRLSNRLGFVRTGKPEETERALMTVLPKKWWIPINGILIAFGRVHCTPISPKCSGCPIGKSCPRIGVGKNR